MMSRERSSRGMLFQGSPVSQPLASVKKICKPGHILVFDDAEAGGCSFIDNKATGEVNALREIVEITFWMYTSPPVTSQVISLFTGRFLD